MSTFKTWPMGFGLEINGFELSFAGLAMSHRETNQTKRLEALGGGEYRYIELFIDDAIDPIIFEPNLLGMVLESIRTFKGEKHAEALSLTVRAMLQSAVCPS